MPLKHHAAPHFFWILKPLGEGASRRPSPACVPRLSFEHDVGRIAPSLSNRCQQAPERGRGGFRMGRTQAHGVARHRCPPCFCFAHLPGSPEKARAGAKAWLRSFAPDCGERTISAGTSPRFGSRFLGFRRSVSIGGEPVAIVACLLRSALWGAGLVEGSFVSMSHSPVCLGVGGLGGCVSWMLHFGFCEDILPQYSC